MIEVDVWAATAAIILMLSGVSAFWHLWYQRKHVTKDEMRVIIDKEIAENAYPKSNGMILENDLKHIKRKVDMMLRSQDEGNKEINQIRQDLAVLISRDK